MIFIVCKIFLYIIYRNNELLLISTRLKSLSVYQFFYLILFLLLVGYLIRIHFFFISWVYSELETRFKKVESLMFSSYMIVLQKTLNRYSTSQLNFVWLKNLFLIAWKQLGDSLKKYGVLLLITTCYGIKSITSKNKYSNLINFISTISNFINQIIFLEIQYI